MLFRSLYSEKTGKTYDAAVVLEDDGPVSYTHLDVYKRQVECRTADKELKTLNEDGEIGLARLFSIWANMMCAPRCV